MKKAAIIAGVAAIAVLPALAFMGVLGLTLNLAGAAANASGAGGCGGGAAQPALEIPSSSTAGSSTKINAIQLQNAGTIITVGRALNVPAQGIEIALMVGLQESGLKNLANTTVPESQQYAHDGEGSDHDSIGIFQQRPGGWGTVQQLMTPDYAAEAFFGGPTGPNHGSPRGLLDVPNWQSMTLTVAAQTVQVSAAPTAYAKWETAAETILETNGIGGAGDDGAGCTGGVGAIGNWTAPNGRTGQDLVDYALQFVGKVPYSGAGGSAGSPAGWGCTGFVYYVYHEVFGIDLNSGVVSGQLALAHQIPQSQAQPGDLIAWVGYHIGIYDGKGGVIHSPDWGRMLTHTNTLFDVEGVHPTFWRVNALDARS